MDVITHNILPFVAMLVVLIVVHELGHLITAKLAGVKVLEFGLGYPPKIWGVHWGETEYTINALPLGGFCRMLGEEDPGDPRSLAAKPRWIRLIVLASGAAMNVVLAIILFSLALMIPRQVDVSRALVGDVVPNSPAAHAGIQPGDVVFAVDGTNVQSVGDLGYQIRLHLGQWVNLKVRRPSATNGTEFINVRVYARWSAQNYTDKNGNVQPQGPTGITIGPAFGSIEAIPLDEQAQIAKHLKPGETVPKTRLRPFSESQWEAAPWKAIPDGSRRAFESLILARNEIISRLKGGVGGSGGFQVTGPVGIAQLTGEVVKEAGWKSLMEFAALISMNLAVLNILPLPMLDGGRIVFVLLEWVRRGKRITPQREAMVHLVGMVAILGFALVVTYFDVARLFNGQSILK